MDRSIVLAEMEGSKMAAIPVLPSDDAAVPVDRSFFGHPRGLSILFMTEMWERFSYYGMRALLILFMTASAARGGLGFAVPKAGAIYGFYTAMVYLMGMPGGWIADRIIGARRAVLWGGLTIVMGHASLAIPGLATFYLGLLLIVVGTGLLKPNISSMVGALYPDHDVRRDAGFSIFYMGINIGALLAPLVCGYLGENINWHYGFAASGVGMSLGLVRMCWEASTWERRGWKAVGPLRTGESCDVGWRSPGASLVWRLWQA